MEAQHWVIIVLYLLGALFPAVALVRVIQASREEAAIYSQAPDIGEQMSTGQFDVMVKILNKRMRRGPVFAVTDAFLVGSGLALGTVASIWAVVDSAL